MIKRIYNKKQYSLKNTKNVWYILIIALLLLLIEIVNLLDINYIKQENNETEIIGKKILILKNKQSKVSIPHLNIKGTVKEVNSNNIDIELSDYAKTFLETSHIVIKNNAKLDKNEKLFIKFNYINIEENKLNYSYIEVYKHINEISITNPQKDFFICRNDYGGFMKINGTSFKYNKNIYFKSDYDLSENNEIYFENITNGILLTEEIKSLIFPFKIYNIINPQETRFDKMLEIYTNNKRSRR